MFSGMGYFNIKYNKISIYEQNNSQTIHKLCIKNMYIYETIKKAKIHGSLYLIWSGVTMKRKTAIDVTKIRYYHFESQKIRHNLFIEKFKN